MNILLVTSGAVQYGRMTLGVQKSQDENKALLASIGWDRLIGLYRQKFLTYGIHTAGFLVAHADLEDHSDRARVFRETVHKAWGEGMIVIVNENDALSTATIDTKRRGEDNDRNALLLAQIFEANLLCLITNTNGVYRDHRDASTRISSLHHHELTESFISTLCQTQSTTGTGGMHSKLLVAREAGLSGIHTHIGNGIDSGIHDLTSGGTNILGNHPI